MEVFMRNLPSDLTENGLNLQLGPFMERLLIADYLCEKPKKKSFGHVTFLDYHDGARFLAAHGQEDLPHVLRLCGRPRHKSKLRLMETDIYCQKSNRPPQYFALKNLQYTAEQRDMPSQKKRGRGVYLLCRPSF